MGGGGKKNPNRPNSKPAAKQMDGMESREGQRNGEGSGAPV